MTAFGLAALPEGGTIEFDGIRADRRRRLIAAMAAAGLDALVLGRPNDVTFATGVRALFTTGSRPFAVACIVVGEHVHVLADHDEGVPAEITTTQIFGRAWNPVNAAAQVAAIPGLAAAGRIGVAGSSRRVTGLLAAIAPGATVVDARAVIAAARSPKSPAEVAVIETAAVLAEAGLAAMRAALRAGATTRELVAHGVERFGELGTPVVTDGYLARRTAAGLTAGFDEVPLRTGDLVSLTPTVNYAGYDATIGRTFVTGTTGTRETAALRARTARAVDAVIGACRPGASGADLVGVWEAAGGRRFDAPLAHGIGIGIEEPLIGMGLGADRPLEAGMVLAVQGWCEDGAGKWHHRDLVHIGESGPRRLTRTHDEAEP